MRAWKTTAVPREQLPNAGNPYGSAAPPPSTPPVVIAPATPTYLYRYMQELQISHRHTRHGINWVKDASPDLHRDCVDPAPLGPWTTAWTACSPRKLQEVYRAS